MDPQQQPIAAGAAAGNAVAAVPDAPFEPPPLYEIDYDTYSSACETSACCLHDIYAFVEASDDVESTKCAHAGWLTDAWSGAGCYHTILWIRE